MKHYVNEADKMLKNKKYEKHLSVKKEMQKATKLKNPYLASNNNN